MLIIKTFLREIPGKGIGLFADEDLNAGQIWWVWNDEIDQVVHSDTYESLDEAGRKFVKKYGVKSEQGEYWLYADHARFCNHSDNPNSEGIDPQFGVDRKIKTIQPVKAGEELTLDYRKFIYDFPDGILNFEVF